MNKEFQKKLNELSKLSGYEKPKKILGSLKLDSNENFVIGKQFQSDLIDAAKKRCDVREYPLGGTEKLISKFPNTSKYHLIWLVLETVLIRYLTCFWLIFAQEKPRF